MKKRLAVLLAAALTAAAAGTTMAAEDIAGEWYTNFYGVAATMTLDESGEYTLAMDMEGEEPQNGSWEFDGEKLILDKGEESEMTLTYDGELLTAEIEEMEMVFSQDPEALIGFTPGEIIADAEIEDFQGEWKGTQVSAWGMVAPLEALEMEKADLSIKDNLVTFTMAGGFMFGEWEVSDLEGELEDGALSFTTPAQDEYSEDTDWTARLHDDGLLSLTTGEGDEEMIFYMERPGEEETEEGTEEAAEETEEVTEEAAE